MQEYLYYFREEHGSSSAIVPYLWDDSSEPYSWNDHKSYGLSSPTVITSPVLSGNNGTFQIPNYQSNQIGSGFVLLQNNVYNPDNPRSPYLIQNSYTADDVSNGTFVYNTFNKFYPRAEPLVEIYIKDVYKYDAPFNFDINTDSPYIGSGDPEPILSTIISPYTEPVHPGIPSSKQQHYLHMHHQIVNHK